GGESERAAGGTEEHGQVAAGAFLLAQGGIGGVGCADFADYLPGGGEQPLVERGEKGKGLPTAFGGQRLGEIAYGRGAIVAQVGRQRSAQRERVLHRHFRVRRREQ